MGIFPIKCDICHGSYIPTHGTHCQSIESELKSYIDSVRQKSNMLNAIINAFRERGECQAEILTAAYALGYSVSGAEFVWLDEELKRLNQQK